MRNTGVGGLRQERARVLVGDVGLEIELEGWVHLWSKLPPVNMVAAGLPTKLTGKPTMSAICWWLAGKGHALIAVGASKLCRRAQEF